MRKISLLALLSIILIVLTACCSGAEYKVAITQYVEHPSLDATRLGFLDALKDAGLV